MYVIKITEGILAEVIKPSIVSKKCSLPYSLIMQLSFAIQTFHKSYLKSESYSNTSATTEVTKYIDLP